MHAVSLQVAATSEYGSIAGGYKAVCVVFPSGVVQTTGRSTHTLGQDVPLIVRLL
jgi:purine nucleoside phosphorylase